jgi:hypothetical protein
VTVELHSKPAFVKRLAAAKEILVKDTVTASAQTRAKYVRLRVVGSSPTTRT